MRVMGLDLGSARIGVAISDQGGILASPYSVVKRSGNVESDHLTLIGLVAELEAELVVVGLPLSLDGSLGPAARAAVSEVELLSKVCPVPVETFDERFTTVSAHRSMIDMKMKGPERRRVVDKVAAAVMLQNYLERANHD